MDLIKDLLRRPFLWYLVLILTVREGRACTDGPPC